MLLGSLTHTYVCTEENSVCITREEVTPVIPAARDVKNKLDARYEINICTWVAIKKSRRDPSYVRREIACEGIQH